MLKADGLPA